MANPAYDLNGLPSIVEDMLDFLLESTPPEKRSLVQFQQIMTLAEETGEFVGAARRYMGLARRSGTRQEMEHELADVIISAFAVSSVLDIDLRKAIAEKLDIIFNRGWRESTVDYAPGAGKAEKR